MSNKVELKGTYGYKNFISETDTDYLVDWVNNNQDSILANGNPLFKSNGVGRKYAILYNVEKGVSDIVSTLKNKIIHLENITDWEQETRYHDYIGINTKGGCIHVHTDPNNIDGYIHTRYNVILSYPEKGGHSIYDGNINVLEKYMVWKCVAGMIRHGSTVVVGDIPRITLSLGFLIKQN